MSQVKPYDLFTELDRPANPWLKHGKALLRIRGELCDAMTWKQFDRWNRGHTTFRQGFELAAKLSKSKRITTLASEGLKLVEMCEKGA